MRDSNGLFLSLVLHLTPSAPFGGFIYPHAYLFWLLFSHKSPQLNGKYLTSSEKWFPLIHREALAPQPARRYYLAAERNATGPGEVTRTKSDFAKYTRSPPPEADATAE